MDFFSVRFLLGSFLYVTGEWTLQNKTVVVKFWNCEWINRMETVGSKREVKIKMPKIANCQCPMSLISFWVRSRRVFANNLHGSFMPTNCPFHSHSNKILRVVFCINFIIIRTYLPMMMDSDDIISLSFRLSFFSLFSKHNCNGH